MGMNKVISIDFEEQVISKMVQRGIPVEYKVMDMLNMESIKDSSIEFVVDKGSLDALCSD
jgi:hypothetical protein